MNFFHLVNVRWFNAVAWYALNLSKAQKIYGHKVLIGALNNTIPAQVAKKEDIETFEASFNTQNPINLLKVIFKTEKVLRNFKSKIINCYRGEFFWYFAFRRLFSKNHILIRFRGDIRKPKKNFINKFLYKKCTDLIITSANFIKDYFIKDFGIDEYKIRVLYGGVDTNFFKPDNINRQKIRQSLGLNDDHFLVGIVGRFDPIKGHKILIEAISYLYYIREILNIRFLIAGFDSVIKKNEIENYVKTNKLEKITYFFDFREDINNVYRACDLIVIPSLGSEAICRVAMEAMATGTPVIGSNTGVLPEILPQENIFYKNDMKDLSEKILKHSKKLFIFSTEAFIDGYMKDVKKLLNS